ncbi:MAG: tetratricopeptide repeat protein, partial [Planctomycetes bacterium]|nr:tetratricopeptide repeat protein [Planctomycetota bacterium]
MIVRLFPGDHPDVADALTKVAGCHEALGDAARALTYFQRALDMTLRISPDERPDLAECLNNLATCLLALGQRSRARDCFERVLAMMRRFYPRDHPHVALTLNNLAYCFDALGQPARALPCYEQALAMAKRLYSADHPNVALGDSNLASCLFALGRPAHALPHFELALQMYQRMYSGDHPDVALGLANQASCLAELGHAARALPLFEQALSMRKRLHRGDHPGVAGELGSLACCLESLGRRSQALRYFEQALGMWKRLYPGDHPDVALSLHNTASCLESIGERDRALSYFEQELAMSERGGYVEGLLRATSFAEVLHAKGERERAAVLLRTAADTMEQLRSDASGLAREDRVLFISRLERHKTYDLAIRIEIELGHLDSAFDYLERARGRGLLDLLHGSALDPLAELRRRALARNDRTTLRAVETLEASLAQSRFDADRALDALRKVRGGPSERVSECQAALRHANAARRRVDTELARTVRDLVPIAKPSEVAALRRLLGRDEAVLAFQIGAADGRVFLVPSAGSNLETARLSIREAALGESIVQCAFGAATRGRTPQRRAEPAGALAALERSHGLFRSLLPDAIWARVKALRRVYLIPHGPLHRLPLEALVTRAPTPGKPPTYWIDEGPEIVYTTSGSVLDWARKRRDAQRAGTRAPVEVVAFGDPVFHGVQVSPLPPEKGCLITEVVARSQSAEVGL